MHAASHKKTASSCKAQAVNDTKRGNERLKRFQETCFEIAGVAAPFPFAPHTLCRGRHALPTATATRKPPTMADRQTVTIDGQEYALDNLSDEAKTQLQNLQATDQEIARLNMQLSIAKTARAAYGQALKAELDKTGSAKADS